jgi:hypothetical protein
MEFLRDQAWDGIGAITAICALLLYVYVERTRIFPLRPPQPPNNTQSTSTTNTGSEFVELVRAIGEALGYTTALFWIYAKDGIAPGIIAVLFLILRQSSEHLIAEIGRYGFLLTISIGLFFPIRFAWWGLRSDKPTTLGLWLLLGAIVATWLCILIATMVWPALGGALSSIL